MFEVSVINDIIFEGNETFHMTIDNFLLRSGVTIGSPSQATVTIVDDDCKQEFII